MNNQDPDYWKLPLYKIYTDDEDVELITKIVRRGTRWAIGPEIEEFEKALADYVGCEYCATLNSGTSALHATFLAYGFGAGDDLIVPSFTFISTVNSVLFVNANPIFADIETDTFGLDPISIQEKVTPNTRAIVPMDYGGLPCKIFDINSLAKQNDLLVIEDGAEALGSSIDGKKVGNNADTTIFSFCGNKVLTTGEGGAVTTNSKDIYEKIKLIRSHGRIDKINYFENTESPNYFGIGYNWRMSSITAALGISQLQKLDKLIKMRQENANFISSRIKKFKAITLLDPPKNHDHIYQMYTICLSTNQLREKLRKFLKAKRIFSKIYFEPVHLTNFYNTKFPLTKKLSITESISQRALTLPLYPNMTSEEKNYLTESIAEFFENSY